MIGAIYSSSLDLLGRGYIVSTLLPVAVALVMLLLALGFTSEAQILLMLPLAGENPDGAERDIIGPLLRTGITVVVVAYLLHGVRNSLQLAFYSGRIFPKKVRDWLLSAQRARRQAQENLRRDALARLQAATWLQYCKETMDAVDPLASIVLEDVYLPKDFHSGKVTQQIKTQVDTLTATFASTTVIDEDTINGVIATVVSIRMLYKHLFDSNQDTRTLAARTKMLVSSLGDATAKTIAEITTASDYASTFISLEKTLSLPSEPYLKPLLLGSIYSLGDEYCSNRYRIPLDILFPRLVAVISTDYREQIATEKQFVDFAFNAFLLSISSLFIFTLFAFAAAIETISNSQVGLPQTLIALLIPALKSLVPFTLYALASLAFYFMTALSIRSHIGYVISAVDLYRLELLAHLGFPQPASMDEEVTFWDKFNTSVQTQSQPSFPQSVKPLLERWFSP